MLRRMTRMTRSLSLLSGLSTATTAIAMTRGSESLTSALKARGQHGACCMIESNVTRALACAVLLAATACATRATAPASITPAPVPASSAATPQRTPFAFENAPSPPRDVRPPSGDAPIDGADRAGPFMVSAGVTTATSAAPAAPPSGSEPSVRLPFPPCAFPSASDKAKIDEAIVILRVHVSAQGKVTHVEILKDPGHDFGATAQACAAKGQFTPAQDAQGQPVAGNAIMRIHFDR
jgi:TonB family protein